MYYSVGKYIRQRYVFYSPVNISYHIILPFLSVAIAAGRHLANRLFGPSNFKDAKLDYSNIPTVVFHGTCGTVGLTESQAREHENFTNVKIYTSKFTNMYYAMTERSEYFSVEIEDVYVTITVEFDV